MDQSQQSELSTYFVLSTDCLCRDALKKIDRCRSFQVNGSPSPISSSEVSSTARPTIVASAAADTQSDELGTAETAQPLRTTAEEDEDDDVEASADDALDLGPGDDDLLDGEEEAPSTMDEGELDQKSQDADPVKGVIGDDDAQEDASAVSDAGPGVVSPLDDGPAHELMEESSAASVKVSTVDDGTADDELDYDFEDEDLPDSPAISLGEDKGNVLYRSRLLLLIYCVPQT